MMELRECSCGGRGCKACGGIGVVRVPLEVDPSIAERLAEARAQVMGVADRPRRKKSTRRSISVRAVTHRRLLDHVEATGGTCSGTLEEWIAAALGDA